MPQDSYFTREFTVNCKGRLLDLSQPKVMGILNITPDSFFDGGKFIEEKQIVRHVKKMINEGAAIIDIGVVSTRPDAKVISERTELQRLMPVLKLLVTEFPEAIFSVDTYRSNVAAKAIEAGAAIINDISGGNMDKKMFALIGELQVPYILMHMQGTPQTMQKNPSYKDIVKEIILFFQNKIVELRKAGAHDIIIDPGFGFGKTTEHNYEILRKLDLFKILECPLMVGVSRKSLINKVLNIKPKHALNGTTVANTIALMNSANILRVHDVNEGIEAIKIVEAYKHSI